MFKVGQMFVVKDENNERTVICLMEIDKKNQKYTFECCQLGYKFKGKRITIDFDEANENLIPNMPIFPFGNIVEDEDRIYIKPKENENTNSI